MHIAVIGAGISGLTTCRTLLSQGNQVTLLEKNAGASLGASGNNGGQLSYAYVAPLATPSILQDLPSLLFSKNAPLSLAASLHPHYVNWLTQFLLHCNQSQLTYTTAALLELAAVSRAETDTWLNTLPEREAVGHRRNGKLVIYTTAKAMRNAEEQLSLQRRFGIHQSLLSGRECVVAEPALKGYEGEIVGGVFTETDEVADCAAICAKLLSQMRSTTAFDFLPNTSVDSFQIELNAVKVLTIRHQTSAHNLAVDAVVVCAGTATKTLLSPLGIHLPILPLKGYSIDLPRAALHRFPDLSITDSKRKVVFAPLQRQGAQRLRVAGFAELNNTSDAIPSHRIDSLLSSTDALFGLQAGARDDAIQWMGHRPVTPHSRPYIGRTKKISNLYVNAGQGALGLTLAFGSAAQLGQIVSNGPTPLSRTLFSQYPLCIG
jgi:D-amino-acid dehydrogenase